MKGTAFRLPCTNAKDILFVATISLFAVFTILLAMFGRMVKKSFSNKTKVHGKKTWRQMAVKNIPFAFWSQFILANIQLI
jgi:hypothetical protein